MSFPFFVCHAASDAVHLPPYLLPSAAGHDSWWSVKDTCLAGAQAKMEKSGSALMYCSGNTDKWGFEERLGKDFFFVSSLPLFSDNQYINDKTQVDHLQPATTMPTEKKRSPLGFVVL